MSRTTLQNIPTALSSWQASCNPESLPVGTQRCELFCRNARRSAGGARQSFDEVGKCDHAHTLESVGRLDFLDRGEGALATLLAVQRQGHSGRLGPGGADDLQGFTDGG